MTKMVNMEFDGKAVSVPEGMTLVDAAATVGIHIPNLCHIKELRGVGACRMCMVEVEGMKTPLTACTTRTKEGMKVQTSTPKVEEIRKFVTDLVLSFHPLDCMTCPKAGACDLQRYAADLGIRESSYGRKSFNYELNDRSPFITLDNNYCILCGRCVRVCKEQGTNVLDFMGRGITTKVSTALDKPLHESGCTFCGSCVDACPVNAIMERDRWQHGREWDLAKQETVCTACGSGCSVVTSSKDGRIVKVNAKEDNGYICAIGRFGFDSLKSESRITTPLKKEGGKLVATTWEEASKIAGDALKKAGANAGFIASGSLTSEEAHAVHSLAHAVGSANVATPSSVYAPGILSAIETTYGTSAAAVAARAGLKDADVIVLIGADPSQKKQSLQEAEVMIRRRAQAGAKVIVVNPETIELAGHQNAIHLAPKEGTDTVLLAGLMSAVIAEGAASKAKGLDALKKALVDVEGAAATSAVSAELIANAGKAYAAAKQPVVVVGTGIAADADASQQAVNLALLKNASIMPLMLEANALGVVQAIKQAGKGYGDMKKGMTALVVAGDVADEFRSDTLIVLASHRTALADKADLVLPLAALYEKQGTIVNTYGASKTAIQAQAPAGEAKDGAEIAAGISTVLSKTKAFKAKDSAAAVKKLKAAKPGAGAFIAVTAKAAKPYAVDAVGMLAAMQRGLVAHSGVAKVIEAKQSALSAK